MRYVRYPHKVITVMTHMSVVSSQFPWAVVDRSIILLYDRKLSDPDSLFPLLILYRLYPTEWFLISPNLSHPR